MEDLENIAHNMLVEGAPATEERGSGGPSRLFEDAAAIDAAESGLGTCSGSECEAGDDELTLPLDGLAAAEDPVLPDESEVPVRPDGSARGAAGKAPPPGRRTLEVQRLADSPRVFFVPNFLTEAEVMHVNAITHPSKARSRGFRVREDFTGASYEQPISEDPALRRIASRMEHLIGFKNEFGGTFRIRRCAWPAGRKSPRRGHAVTQSPTTPAAAPLGAPDAEGEYHPPHTDTYTVRGENVTLLVTLITYLTDVEEGGETVFPDAVPAPVSIVPKRGGLGVWFSCNEEGGDDR